MFVSAARCAQGTTPRQRPRTPAGSAEIERSACPMLRYLRCVGGSAASACIRTLIRSMGLATTCPMMPADRPARALLARVSPMSSSSVGLSRS
eukprot:scaffold2339_cov368-Prasinococcus_capsulatus_cf.AAC.10